MSTENDILRAPVAATEPAQNLIAVQFVWQELFWQMALAPWRTFWSQASHTPLAACHAVAPDGHDQLEVPPSVAADGEHALFA